MSNKFFSLTNPAQPQSAPHGTRIKQKRAVRYNERGNKYLAVVGTEDLYAYIQSFAGATDINNIVARAQMAGTLDELAVGGVYADATKLPQTLAESYEILRNVENYYNALSPEQQLKYGDFKTFVNSFGNANGVARFLEMISPAPAKDVAPDVSAESEV